MINLSDPQVLSQILTKYGFHFSKKLGQNFLIDSSIAPRIAEYGNAKKGFCVLEIGPGIGTLTQHLAKNADIVTAVELDQRLLPVLKETVGEFENLHVIHGDILEQDLNTLFQEEFGDAPVAVCANLPYYITTPILMYFLESNVPIQSITVMVQKEVAEKLCAPVGKREAGAITAAIQYYGTAEYLFDVPRDCFMPAPNVDSAVIQICPQRRYEDLVLDQKHLFYIIKQGFAQRRKTLVNSLSATTSYDKPLIQEALGSIGLPNNIRMEKLTMEEIIDLSNYLYKCK